MTINERGVGRPLHRSTPGEPIRPAFHEKEDSDVNSSATAPVRSRSSVRSPVRFSRSRSRFPITCIGDPTSPASLEQGVPAAQVPTPAVYEVLRSTSARSSAIARRMSDAPQHPGQRSWSGPVALGLTRAPTLAEVSDLDAEPRPSLSSSSRRRSSCRRSLSAAPCCSPAKRPLARCACRPPWPTTWSSRHWPPTVSASFRPHTGPWRVDAAPTLAEPDPFRPTGSIPFDAEAPPESLWPTSATPRSGSLGPGPDPIEGMPTADDLQDGHSWKCEATAREFLDRSRQSPRSPSWSISNRAFSGPGRTPPARCSPVRWTRSP